MANLVSPVSAVSFKESIAGLPKTIRHHILNPNGGGITVCNCVPPPRSYYVFSAVSSLRVSQLCKECLGSTTVLEDKDTRMTRIYTPHRAIGFKERKSQKVSSKSKYHLMKSGGDPTQGGLTVCNLIIRSNSDLKELFGCENRSEIYDHPLVTSLPANQLCKTCLGPLKVED